MDNSGASGTAWDKESALIHSGLTSAYTTWVEEVQKSQESAAASARRAAALTQESIALTQEATELNQEATALTQEATALAGHWPVGGTDWAMAPDVIGAPAPVGGWGEWVAAQSMSSESPAAYQAMIPVKGKEAARRVAALRVQAGLKPEAPAPPPRRSKLPTEINDRIATYLRHSAIQELDRTAEAQKALNLSAIQELEKKLALAEARIVELENTNTGFEIRIQSTLARLSALEGD